MSKIIKVIRHNIILNEYVKNTYYLYINNSLKFFKSFEDIYFIFLTELSEVIILEESLSEEGYKIECKKIHDRLYSILLLPPNSTL